jgi:hypothetical protein
MGVTNLVTTELGTIAATITNLVTKEVGTIADMSARVEGNIATLRNLVTSVRPPHLMESVVHTGPIECSDDDGNHTNPSPQSGLLSLQDRIDMMDGADSKSVDTTRGRTPSLGLWPPQVWVDSTDGTSGRHTLVGATPSNGVRAQVGADGTSDDTTRVQPTTLGFWPPQSRVDVTGDTNGCPTPVGATQSDGVRAHEPH